MFVQCIEFSVFVTHILKLVQKIYIGHICGVSFASLPFVFQELSRAIIIDIYNFIDICNQNILIVLLDYMDDGKCEISA